MQPGMTSADVLGFYTQLDSIGVKIWIIGGWGVDALLGTQTRPHSDLDIVIQQQDVSTACNFLKAHGYNEVPRDDTSPWNFVMGDRDGHEIDFHVVVFDDQGNGIYGPAERGVIYPPAGSLCENGMISDHSVRCISPEQMVKDHTGYKLREVDFKDVSALCKKFGIPFPHEYY